MIGHRNDRQHGKVYTALRRRALKVLALAERLRVRLLPGWERVSGAVAKHPVSPLFYAVLAVTVVGAMVIHGMYTPAYALTVDGVEVGVVASEDDVNTMVAHLEMRASSLLGEEYSYGSDIELTPILTDEISDMNQMEELMFASAGALTEAYAIAVDGAELGYAATEEELTALLDRVAEPYLTDDTLSFDFVEDVVIYPVELPSNTVFCLDDLYDTLTACTVEEARYEVQKGDTFNQIAYALEMSPQDLSLLNPDVTPAKIWVGQELIIQQAVPFLSVRTYTNETYESVLASPIEYIETPNLYVGNTSVKEQGKDGLALLNADVIYVNGFEVGREVLETHIIEEPSITYVYTGTTPRPKTASNGYYKWPVSGRVTSGYGWRTLFGSRDFHLGIDIGCAYGTTVKASDGGKVTYAGWKGSYGKLVIITHDDGSKTYYAHNSQILVNVGDRVYQGQPISKVGLTGTTTGPHLHFEIRINGRTVNPLNYL